MPFTLAHPAAIIPVHRIAGRWSVLSALIIGSMTPDFVYFLPVHVTGGFTHGVPGIFLFCVPAGLIAYVAFHSLLRTPLTSLLPERISNRIALSSTSIPRTLFAFAAIVASLAFGAFTHIAWDAFTHANTTIVKNLDILRYSINLAADTRIPVYKLLQHLSSIVGLAVLVFCTARWLASAPIVSSNPIPLKNGYRNTVLGFLIAAGVAGAVAGVLRGQGKSIERTVFDGVVGGVGGMALAVLLFCFVWHIVVYRKTSRS